MSHVDPQKGTALKVQRPPPRPLPAFFVLPGVGFLVEVVGFVVALLGGLGFYRFLWSPGMLGDSGVP